MSEKNIILISQEYAESIFVTGPKFDSLSAFVSGPDAQVQGKLTASTGINLNDNTISVDTATAVGTSNLPVTASAVNTKLGDYATTTDLNNKQDKLSWYSESGGSMDPYKVDIAANEVTLRAGGDTSGMIDENVRLTLSQNYGDNTDIKIETYSDSSASWHNVLSATRYGEISLGDPQMSVFINGPLYDKDGNKITGGGGSSSFNYISEDDNWPTSLLLGRGPNGDASSVFVCGPLYGSEGTIFVDGPIMFNGTAKYNNPIYISVPGQAQTGNAKLYIRYHDTGGIDGFTMEADADNYISSIALNSYMGSGSIVLKTGNVELELNETKLNKLKQLLES